MLRKILGFTLVVYALALFTPAGALGWGCGSWSRSGSASFTGRYGNTYSPSWSGSGSGYRYGGWGGSHYGGYYGGGRYYGGGFHPGLAYAAGYASGVYNSQPYY